MVRGEAEEGECGGGVEAKTEEEGVGEVVGEMKGEAAEGVGAVEDEEAGDSVEELRFRWVGGFFSEVPSEEGRREMEGFTEEKKKRGGGGFVEGT